MAKTYYTFRIRITNNERVQVEKWNDQGQSKGEPFRPFRYKEKLERITSLLQPVLTEELNNSKQARALGEALFDAIFDEVLRQEFVNFYQEAVRDKKQLLRIELDIDEQTMPEVAALPWEFMCLPASANLGELWLGTDPNLVFSRRRTQWYPAPPIQLEEGEKLRIALAIAAPKDLGTVKYEDVHEALQALADNQSERIEFLPVVNPANPSAINELLEQKPHIFHFIGHGQLQNAEGEEVGQIALVKKVFNTALWVDAGFFAGLFKRHVPGVVLLQACESGMLSASQAFAGVASKIVEENIPVVVAMQYEVPNITASQFAYEFYERLAKGEPVDIAAQNGRNTIAIENQYRKRDFATPVVFMRVEDGYLFKHQQDETDDLRSERGVDYTKLRNLLAWGQWKEADKETLTVMLNVVRREKEDLLRVEDIENFPCTDLRTIDTLWVKYSKGRFGFSVQKRIWESAGGTSDANYETFEYFGNHVKWRVNNKWLRYTDFTFSTEAPRGHLPLVLNWQRNTEVILERQFTLSPKRTFREWSWVFSLVRDFSRGGGEGGKLVFSRVETSSLASRLVNCSI